MESSYKRRNNKAWEVTARPKPKAREKFSPRWLRIVAGEFRSRKILYSGDPNVRPMKDRTRESVFNLIGGDLTDFLAIDLFGGTGVLAIESVSRGATRAIALEMSRAAVGMILENIAQLKIGDRVEVHNVDTLRWLKHVPAVTAAWPKLPWVVFCCPPYQMWKQDTDRLCAGLRDLYDASPQGSRFVIESEDDFDASTALAGINWDIRPYKPARIAVAQKPFAELPRDALDCQ